MFESLGMALALMMKTAGDNGVRAYNSRSITEPEALIAESYLDGFREAMGVDTMRKEAAVTDQIGAILGVELAMRVFGEHPNAR